MGQTIAAGVILSSLILLLPVGIDPAHAASWKKNSPQFTNVWPGFPIQPITTISMTYASLPADERLQIEEAARANQPVFVFIPGILGSALYSRDGKTLWGHSSADAEGLHYKKSPEVVAELLHDFSVGSGIFSSDVYGKFYNEVKALDIGDVEHFITFSYDWRQDNRRTAKQFNDFLLSKPVADKLKNRNVIFVAHSMGGLIYRYWSKYFYLRDEKSYGFRRAESLLLGVPNRGAPQALYRIVSGEVFDGLENFVLEIFGNVPSGFKKVGYSFPSLYQLLPIWPDSVVRIRNDSNMGPVPVFETNTWKNLKLLEYLREDRPDVYEEIADMLKSAREFQREIGDCSQYPEVTYFYVGKNDTRSTISIVHEDDTAPDPSGWAHQEKSGDGTVPTWSAACPSVHPKARRDVAGDHVSMMKSNEFLNYVRELRDYAMRNSRYAMSQKIKGSKTLLKTLIDNGVILEIPIDQKTWKDKEVDHIKEINTKILLGIKAKGLTPFFNQNLALKAGGSKERAGILSQYLDAVVVSQTQDANQMHYASQRLAATLHGQERFKIAEPYSNLAAAIIPQHDDLEIVKQANGRSHNTLGAIQWSLGKKKEAKFNFKKAVEFGSDKASNNLKLLFLEKPRM